MSDPGSRTRRPQQPEDAAPPHAAGGFDPQARAQDATLGAEEVSEMLTKEELTPFQQETISAAGVGKLVVGGYILLDQLGEGGMGKVYKARHQDMDRIVALKMLPPGRLASDFDKRRFQQEVKAAARLNHPNIVTAYDADVSSPTPYLVMEYVDGQDLQARVLRDGPLTVEQAVDYIRQAARGLEHAHRTEIVHRDVKPANLLVDRRGTVRILDLGVAGVRRLSMTNQQTPGDAQVTRSGVMVGTIDFMAPEQAVNTSYADGRSDIYSLGCSLFFLLTGRTLFRGGTAMEKLLAHREQPPPSLSALRPDAPEALDRIFQAMVAKDPTSRQQTMAHVIEQLSVVAGDEQPAVPPDADPASAPDPPRTAPSVPLLLLLAASAFLAGVAYFAPGEVRRAVFPQETGLRIHINEPGASILLLDMQGEVRLEQSNQPTDVTCRIEPGVYHLQVLKDGFAPFVQTVTLQPSTTRRIDVQLILAADPPDSPEAPTPPSVESNEQAAPPEQPGPVEEPVILEAV